MSVTTRILRYFFGAEGDVATDVPVVLMVAAAAILTTGIIVVSPLVASLAPIFGVSEERAGLLILALTAPQPIMVPVLGVLADRVGRKTVFVPGLILFGLAGVVTGLTTIFEVALAARFVQGIGFAAAMPLTLALFGDLYESSRESTAQGLRNVGINFIYIATPFVVALLFVRSWRYPFFLYGLAIPIGILSWIYLPSIELERKRSLKDYLSDLLAFLGQTRMILYLLSFIARFFLLFGFMTYISVLVVQDIGLAVVAVSLIISVKGFFSLIGSTQAGRVMDRFGAHSIVSAGFLTSGIGLGLVGIVPTVHVLFIGTILYGIGDGVLGPAQVSMVNRLPPKRLRGSTMAIASTFQNVGKVIGPATFGAAIAALGSATTFAVLGFLGGAVGVASIAAVVVLQE